MRKINVLLIIGIIISFIAHGVMGSIQMMGSDTDTLKTIARLSLTLIIGHVLISSVLTYQSLQARRLSKAGYFKDNLLFWTRRISGLVIIIPLIMHVLIFLNTNSGAYRVEVFDHIQLISQILLVISIAFHALLNIKPLLIAMGVQDTKSYMIDILFVLSVLLLFFAIAFFIYYLRWVAV